MQLNDKQIRFLKDLKQYYILPGIYEIWSPSNKVYIGQTTNFYKRFQSYFEMRCKGQRKLYHSFLKHGVENHDIIPICLMHSKYPKENLDLMEKHFIDYYKRNGYELLNIREGGIGGGNMAQETKNILSEKAKKRGKWAGNNNPRSKDKLLGDRNGMFGRNHSDFSKEKIVLTKIERYGDKLVENAKNKESKRKQSIVDWKIKVSVNRVGKGRIKPRKVVQLSENYEYIAEYDSMNKAGIALGIAAQHISKSVRRRKFAPTTRFYFMYKEDWEKNYVKH